MRRCALVLAILSVNAVAAVGQGREGAPFLTLPAGRAAALGGAGVALPPDAFGVLNNPGGLATVRQPQVGLQHAAYAGDVAYEHFSLALPFKRVQAVGVTARYFGSGSLPGADVDGMATGDFGSHYGMAGLSYAVRLGRTSLGATGKRIQSRLGEDRSAGTAWDAGVFQHVNEHFFAGAAVTNAGQGLRFNAQEDPLPTAYTLGFALRPSRLLTLAVDGSRGNRDRRINVRGGAEWKPFESFIIRGGYRSDGAGEGSGWEGASAGIGLLFEGQEISYAWLPMGGLGTTHLFSLVWSFGEPWRGDSLEGAESDGF